MSYGEIRVRHMTKYLVMRGRQDGDEGASEVEEEMAMQEDFANQVSLRCAFRWTTREQY